MIARLCSRFQLLILNRYSSVLLTDIIMGCMENLHAEQLGSAYFYIHCQTLLWVLQAIYVQQLVNIVTYMYLQLATF